MRRSPASRAQPTARGRTRTRSPVPLSSVDCPHRLRLHWWLPLPPRHPLPPPPWLFVCFGFGSGFGFGFSFGCQHLTFRAVKRAEHRSLTRPKSSPCLSEASLGCVPRQARSGGDRRGAAASARVRRWRFDSRLRHSPCGPASPFASAFALSCLLLTRQK